MQLLSELFKQFLERLQKKQERDGAPEFSTSLEIIDDMTGGLSRGGITIIAGTPGSGKTSLALQMAITNAAELNNHVLFLSLEQDSITLVGRMFCNYCGIDNSALRNGMFIENDVKTKISDFEKFINKIDMQIVERGYNFDEVIKIIKEGYENIKPDILFVDYIQLIKWGGFSNQNTAIIQYIRDLAELAKKHQMAIVLCSQINREGIKNGKKPTMFDLYGSGSLEQAASIVLILYKQENETFKGDSVKQTYISLEKNRLGEKRFDIPVNFMGKYYKFYDTEQEEVPF